MDIYGAAKLFSRTSQLTQDFEVNLLAKNAFKINVTLKTSQVDFPHDLVYRTVNGDIPLVPNQPLEFLTNQQMASADGQLHFTTTFGAQEGLFVSSSRQIAEEKAILSHWNGRPETRAGDKNVDN